MNYIDRFLNSITMYRLVLYGLAVLAVIALALSFFGIVPFSPLALVMSGAVLLVACFGTNYLLSKLTGQPMNLESADITALILFFIMMPSLVGFDLLMLAVTGALAMLSKYVFAVRHKHIFNPAAIAAVIMGLAGSGLAIWWMATPWLLPFTLVLGLLVVRKIRHFALFLSFMVTAIITLLIYGMRADSTFIETLKLAFASYPLIFLGSIMLTEPLTTPPTKRLQAAYGALVGVLFGVQFHIGPFFSTPELAIALGNIFSYIISPKDKLKLLLASSRRLSADIYEFVFTSARTLNFRPGQYLEWTLPRFFLDGRGNRRYFTIASSPTEGTVRLGVRVFDNGSRFKKELLALQPGEAVWASQLSGDFVLPADASRKLVFLAGGIGITPFRSMVKYLVDKNEQRDIILIYSCMTEAHFVYKEIFSEAEKLGLKTKYLSTEQDGYLTKEILSATIADLGDRLFYLSGPNSMVEAYEKLLLSLHVHRSNIIKDYFPGF